MNLPTRQPIQVTTLPSGDRTPPDFRLPTPTIGELLKRPLRRWLYPLLNVASHRRLAKRYTPGFHVDRWLLDQRGNNYQAHRRRVNSMMPVRDRDVLVLGCGTTRDLPSWYPFGPRSITGVDFFSYQRAWEELRAAAPVPVHCVQGDIAHMPQIGSSAYDIVASDAVFEHVANFPEVITESHRVLRAGGLLYAAWGACWYSYAGDHVSGYDGIEAGYNHLLLDKSEYDAYLDRLGPFEHRPEDGRLWAKFGLFSYLRPKQYIDIIDQKFDRLWTCAVVNSKGVEFLRRFPEKAAQLRQRASEVDLAVMGLVTIARRR